MFVAFIRLFSMLVEQIWTEDLSILNNQSNQNELKSLFKFYLLWYLAFSLVIISFVTFNSFSGPFEALHSWYKILYRRRRSLLQYQNFDLLFYSVQTKYNEGCSKWNYLLTYKSIITGFALKRVAHFTGWGLFWTFSKFLGILGTPWDHHRDCRPDFDQDLDS